MYPFFSQNFRPMKLFSEASEIFVGKRARKNQLTLTTKFLTYENMLVDEVGYNLYSGPFRLQKEEMKLRGPAMQLPSTLSV